VSKYLTKWQRQQWHLRHSLVQSSSQEHHKIRLLVRKPLAFSSRMPCTLCISTSSHECFTHFLFSLSRVPVLCSAGTADAKLECSSSHCTETLGWCPFAPSWSRDDDCYTSLLLQGSWRRERRRRSCGLSKCFQVSHLLLHSSARSSATRAAFQRRLVPKSGTTHYE